RRSPSSSPSTRSSHDAGRREPTGTRLTTRCPWATRPWAPASPTAPPAPTPPAREPAMTRVLLADDHQLLREGLRRYLEEAGLDVVAEACDGVEAVRLAEATAPDVVLMDVTMPVLDGI